VNPAAAFSAVFTDELMRCGVREAVLAPGSRSAPLALEFFGRAAAGGLRLHVRIDERSAAFLALGLAKASGRPVVMVCTSGTAAAHFHAAVIEADEAGIPLIVLTADRPPELRGTGASQTIDQLKLYGAAVRWFSEAGVPEARAGMTAYWRSLACRAWAHAAGTAGGAGGFPGPVHVNVPLREPLVPAAGDGGPGDAGEEGAVGGGWPEPLDGRPGGAAWTAFGPPVPPGGAGTGGSLELGWTERGVVVCGDGHYPAAPLLALAEQAGWPVLAEPSSNARQGRNALSAYPFLLEAPGFTAAHRPDVIISAGRPGLSRGQLALLRGAGGPGAGRGPGAGGPGAVARHIVLAQGPGRWADAGRSATEVTASIQLIGGTGAGAGDWLASWQRADAAARTAVDAVLARGEARAGDGLLAGDEPLAGPALTEPALARELAAALPDGGLLWAASSLPVRDLDQQMSPRPGLRVLASRGTSGIDGLVSAAIGAALAHQAGGGGPAAALLGDLAFLHDAPGLMLGPAEPRPDLCLVVVNNNGGGIFSTLEQAALTGSFERVFGTPHGADLAALAAAAGLPYARLGRLADLPSLLAGTGLRVVEARTDRAAGAALRAELRAAASAALGQLIRTRGSSRA
jgi:2-succinyl-5-enolpyruvyl-6-hydroxy-3-cyclohexene-1-carboxylate synthase